MELTWDGVLAWRLRRQFLDPVGSASAVEVVSRLCGVHAQVSSAAELAVAVRQTDPRVGALREALEDRPLEDRPLLKTWAMRGTLHALTVEQAPTFLSLLAASRSWERAAWQRAFLSAAQLAALTEVVLAALDGRVLGREELVAEVAERTGDPRLVEQLRSGWGAALKPLAWQGMLCHGPARGNRVTFTRPDTWLPDWSGLVEPEQAARVAIPAYLAAYGPATPEAFDRWLTRGVSKKGALRAWFAALEDELVTVDVEGQQGYARATDIDELASSHPSQVVRLLPGFDQYVLGPGTNDTRIIPAGRRALVSKAAGWISPVVVAGGRVAGTWETTADALAVSLFPESGTVAREALEAEAARLGAVLGTSLSLSVSSV